MSGVVFSRGISRIRWIINEMNESSINKELTNKTKGCINFLSEQNIKVPLILNI